MKKIKNIKDIKVGKDHRLLKITMPEHFTRKQINETIKTFKDIVKTFAKLTGESPKIKVLELKDPPEKPKDEI